MVMCSLGSRKEGFFTSGITPRDYLSLWLTSSAFGLGLFALWSEQLYLLPFFFVAGYLAVLLAFFRAIHIWRDIFNPLCIVIAIGVARFSLPVILLLIGVEPSQETELFFELMGLSARDWQFAHALALTSVLGVV